MTAENEKRGPGRPPSSPLGPRKRMTFSLSPETRVLLAELKKLDPTLSNARAVEEGLQLLYEKRKLK